MCSAGAIPGVEPFRRQRCRMIGMDALHHLQGALRSFGRQPGLTTIIVGTLALGVGLNAAVFAVAYTVLWRPLPYPEPDRLATIELTHGGDRSGGVRPARYRDWSDRLRSGDLAGVEQRERRVRGNGPARITATALVSENFFDVLGVGAARGRLPRLTPGDGRAVISGRLAGELADGRDAVGQMLSVGNELLEIVAVMSDEFGLPSGAVDVWTAPPPGREPSEGRFDLIARLHSGATLAQLTQEAERISRELRGDDWSAVTSRLDNVSRGDRRPALLVAQAAAGLVLVVACLSAITMLMGRSVARRREFALRRALGAGTMQVLRMAAVEGLVLAAAGLTIGLALAAVGIELFKARATTVLPRVPEMGLDLPPLAAASVVTMLVALACGGASAAGALRSRGIEPITGAGRAVSPAARRLRASLVAGQIALAVVLLAAAGLLARSVGALLTEDGGYDAGRVVIARLMLDDSRFPDDRALVDFVNRLLREVRALPTVTAAGVGSMLPPADAPISINLWMRSDTRDDRMVLSWGAVTSGFFEALGTSLEDGRRFRVEDERAVIPNVILSVSAARFIFRDDNAIGKSMGWAVERMALTRDTAVLGVVGDMKYRGLAADRDASIYVPWPQRPMGMSYLVVRSSGSPSALIPALRTLIARLDPTLPLPEVRTLEDHVADSIAGRRLQLVPAAAMAALALAVSMVGLFGALGRAVAERRHELSIRAAVGASPARLVRLVAVGGLAITTVGLLAGLASAALVGRGLAGLLYGVSPYDPLTFSGAALLVAAGAVPATLVPARRAARLDPVLALGGA